MRRKRKSNKQFLLIGLVAVLFLSLATAAGTSKRTETPDTESAVISSSVSTSSEGMSSDLSSSSPDETPTETASSSSGTNSTAVSTSSEPTSATDSSEVETGFDPASVPDYSGTPAVVVNNNIPFFTDADLTTEAFENYSDLDSLGRCGVAYANICQDLMPTEERGEIGMIKPSGWHTVKYAGIDGNYLYNRCHLIGFQLAGENANEKNLITGTRYLNVDGMLPFENQVADYVKSTDHHALYRVTPIFENDNLLASGVLMEAKSVEDDGLIFCIYCYNVQPGVTIDYSTGDSTGPEYTGSDSDKTGADQPPAVHVQQDTSTADTSDAAYVLNTNTMKFHKPDCSSVSKISQANRQDVNESRSDLIAEGYEPCKICNP